ncbi:MAG: hypothetical protein UZ10_BCD003000988 [Bacteroidetes bacterium OLB10]|nr:MAG: hypothetical protein UZ10_BCD003000988 [Bacteroidetes bacterium OLB10]
MIYEKLKSPHKKGEKVKAQKLPIKQKGILEKLEYWLNENHKKVFISVLILNVIFIFLHFNLKISEANDDSMYIEDAFRFAKDFFWLLYS